MFRNCIAFLNNKEANVAMIFGLVAVPLVGAVGALADYARAAETRTKVQAVIDGAAISLARRAVTLNSDSVQTEGEALVRAQLANRADLTVQTVTVNKGTTAITINVAGSVPANFARMWGHTQIPLSANTQVAWGARKIEVALVLDNTGSMSSSGKMEALKTAATNFINTLEGVATEAGSVKVSIVPFDTTVRVDTANTNEPWLTKYYIPAWQQPSWNGCIMDRDQNYDVNDAAPVAGSLTTLFPAKMCPSTTLAKVMPMSSDFNGLRTRISEMQPSGNTNVTIGIAWGLATLSPDAPMGGALAFGTADLEKFMIVLTDGDNTQNRWTYSTTSIDARTLAACNTVKGLNVKLYTVRVINGNASLLQSCATNTNMYYNVSNASQLDPVFQQIANSIRAIRLTH
jgi:Flp pilus assembly protein TadG